MKRRVVVTGIGAVTSLSCKVDDLWQKILRGQSGVHALRAFDATNHKVKFAGDIYDWTTDGYIDRKEEKRIDRFTQFAMVAGIDAVKAYLRLREAVSYLSEIHGPQYQEELVARL